MNTPTEAHYELRQQVIHFAPDEGAQLIAASEARAITKQVEALAILTLRWDKAEKERDQLRAEVESLHRIANAIEKAGKEQGARAKRAEAAETVALAKWNGALQRAEKAEADLAAAKERLRSEAMDDYASIKDLQRELAIERAKKADQGLTLACLCDGILGEDSADRSDQTLVRVGCRMKAELAAERARLDWVFRNCKVTADDYRTGHRDVYAIHDREDLGAAMKEDAK